MKMEWVVCGELGVGDRFLTTGSSWWSVVSESTVALYSLVRSFIDMAVYVMYRDTVLYYRGKTYMDIHGAIETAWSLIEGLAADRPMVIGLGSGTTIIPFITAINHHPLLTDSIFIPTSLQSKWLLDSLHLRSSDLNSHLIVDVCVDGCDAFDEDNNLIKGGGGCMLQEKMVAEASKVFVILAREEKRSAHLLCKRPIPIEVHKFNVNSVINKMKKTFPECDARIREGSGKLGPVLTDSGNLIVDLYCTGTLPITQIHNELTAISGVLETGLFLNMNPKIITFT